MDIISEVIIMKGRVLRRFVVIAAAILVIIMVSVSVVLAEFVFLKDGSIVEGTILNDALAHIVLRGTDKKNKQIPRDKILRILYTELKMGKIYIQKRDGKGLVAYMVDEDRTTYTFRKELYKPEEFTIPRNDILFISEKNPSGLQVVGNVGTDRVSLTWHPPYDEVKKYNLYIKKSEKEKYSIIESSKDRSITLKKLLSNTTYYLIVTSIDSDNYESPPSNELKITTKNIPPEEPEIVSVERPSKSDRKISWKPATDPDGKVEKYRLYATREKKREQIAEIKATEYMLKDTLSFDKVELVAVDNNGDESGFVRVKVTDKDRLFEFHPGVLKPLGKFGEISGHGYGGSIAYKQMNTYYKHLELGTELGFYYITGKDAIPTNAHKTEKAYFVPLYLICGYRLELAKSFALVPFVSAGAAYMYMDYLSRDKNTFVSKKKKLNDFGPAANAGLAAYVSIGEAYFLSVRAYAGYLIGAKYGLFAVCDLGITYRM